MKSTTNIEVTLKTPTQVLTFPVSEVIEIKLEPRWELSPRGAIQPMNKAFLYLDRLPDGTWRMTFTSGVAPVR